ncbi:MAG: ATP-dependent Clp protease adapter ClpS [Nevskiaceae bacterium]|nr:ATP-dependent Clp protease adapter ClpS [Nevskiaceae bacterium]
MRLSPDSDPVQFRGIVAAAAEEDPPGWLDEGRGLVVEEAQPQVKQPPLYNVVLLNDDYTPMEFVVDVLERFFRMDRSAATRIMLEVHVKGRGICGVFTYEIAETKVAQVMNYSRDNQHPLMCTMEEA